MTEIFWKAVLIGFSIAAPVGPIGLLCAQRSLAHGARIGFLSGLGAAAADAVYGALGAFGVAALTHRFAAAAPALAVLGALFLGWMGGGLWRAGAPENAAAPATAEAATPGAVRAFGSVFALTLANPLTILSFVAVFAAIAGPARPDAGAAATLVAGVFVGSAAWWLLLALGVAAVRHRLAGGTLRTINRLSGACLLGFALWQLLGIVGR